MHMAASERELLDDGNGRGAPSSALGPLLGFLGLGENQKGTAPLGARARAKIRSVVLMLRRHAQASQAEAEEARQERDAAMALAEERQRELLRVKRLAEYMSKYTSEVEEDRDNAVEALRSKSAELAQLEERLRGIEPEQWAQALKEQKQLRKDNAEKLLALSKQVVDLEERLRTADAKRWAEVAQGVESALLRGGIKKVVAMPDEPPTEAGVVQPPTLVDMSFEDLQWECVLRGISPDGSLAALRTRVRAARARDRREQCGSDAGAAGGT